VLILIGRRMTVRPGRLMAVYVVGYAIGRFWIEGLRIDPAQSGGGWRLNQWVAVVAGSVALIYLVVDQRRHRGDVSIAPVATVDVDRDGHHPDEAEAIGDE